jgi:hypothetical protein
MASRFLIVENFSPQLAYHLAFVHGFDAAHVRDLGLLGRRTLTFSRERSPRIASSSPAMPMIFGNWLIVSLVIRVLLSCATPPAGQGSWNLASISQMR